MTKRKPIKKQTQTTDIIETIGDVVVEEISTPPNNVEKPKKVRKPRKPVVDKSKEKLKSMPQTYVEDTFDINSLEQVSCENIIENVVVKKVKVFATREEVSNSVQFKLSLSKLKSEIEYNKSFSILLDFVKLSKFYRKHFITDSYDEVDLLLEELVKHFKKRLVNIELDYADYQKVNWFFERLTNLYNDFNHSEMARMEKLNKDLETMKAMENFMGRTFF